MKLQMVHDIYESILRNSFDDHFTEISAKQLRFSILQTATVRKSIQKVQVFADSNKSIYTCNLQCSCVDLTLVQTT